MALSKLINKIMRYPRCTTINMRNSIHDGNICQLHGADTFSSAFALQQNIIWCTLLFISWNLQLRIDK